MAWLLSLLAGVALTTASSRRYDNYHVITLGPFNTIEERDALLDIHAFFRENYEVFTWTEPTGLGPFDVMVAPPISDEYLSAVSDLPHTVATKNIQEWIDKEDEKNEITRNKRVSQNTLQEGKAPEFYMRYDEILDWLKTINGYHPTRSELIYLGLSYEGRNITGIKITSGEGNRRILMDCGMNARDWIAPATCIWFIDKLLNEYDTNADSRRMVDNFEWYIVPVLNADGYEYTHVSDRMWRKTRTPGRGSACFGADPNRNWDVYWGMTGISFDECSGIYPGHSVWSEPCVRAVRDLVLDKLDNMVLFLSVRSYSQMLLVPWSYTRETPPDDAKARQVAEETVLSMFSVHRRDFIVGSSSELLGYGSGSAMDWAKLQGIPYAYGAELRPASAQEGGFVINPVPNIRRSGKEFFEGLARLTQLI